LKYLPYGLNV